MAETTNSLYVWGLWTPVDFKYTTYCAFLAQATRKIYIHRFFWKLCEDFLLFKIKITRSGFCSFFQTRRSQKILTILTYYRLSIYMILKQFSKIWNYIDQTSHFYFHIILCKKPCLWSKCRRVFQSISFIVFENLHADHKMRI